jgi:hypothetical protein
MFTKLSVAISRNHDHSPNHFLPVTTIRRTDKNGRIIDGSGQSGYNGDIAIKGQRLPRRQSQNATATRTIDANGLVVAPVSSTC